MEKVKERIKKQQKRSLGAGQRRKSVKTMKMCEYEQGELANRCFKPFSHLSAEWFQQFGARLLVSSIHC